MTEETKTRETRAPLTAEYIEDTIHGLFEKLATMETDRLTADQKMAIAATAGGVGAALLADALVKFTRLCEDVAAIKAHLDTSYYNDVHARNG